MAEQNNKVTVRAPWREAHKRVQAVRNVLEGPHPWQDNTRILLAQTHEHTFNGMTITELEIRDVSSYRDGIGIDEQ